MNAADPLLRVADLKVVFYQDGRRRTHAVDGVDLNLGRGRTLGLVGESGCGKSVTALAIMGLLPAETSEVSGTVCLADVDLLALPAAQLRDLRGDRLAMIFQEPMTSLNPSYTVGEQIIEVLRRHRGLRRASARAASIELLRSVGISSPQTRVDEYPHQLSGGMRQRVMIAMALACGPELLIADEPTTALDVTIQAQILDLLRELKTKTGTAIILITHDLGVVAETCDEVAVMYAGLIVERGPVAAVFEQPEHPYTLGLLASIPRLDQPAERLPAMEGAAPDLTQVPTGCRFAPRCPFADQRCHDQPPPIVTLDDQRWSRCFRSPLAELVA